MIKHLLSISLCAGLLAVLLGSSGCQDIGDPTPPKPKGIVALVYTDLTPSINAETADRQKQNIENLFQNLPIETQFFLFSIDGGANKPSIYEYTPTFIKPKRAQEQKTLEKQKTEKRNEKANIELEKLKSSLNSYDTRINREQGAASCLSNKMNSLVDLITSKKVGLPEYEIRVYFYSDMIEECKSSFDSKPLSFKKDPDDKKEAANLKDIQERIEKHFQPGANLKSMGVSIYIILTSQDDKQSEFTLKGIWNNFFGKLGYEKNDIKWTLGNELYFWAPPANPPTS